MFNQRDKKKGVIASKQCNGTSNYNLDINVNRDGEGEIPISGNVLEMIANASVLDHEFTNNCEVVTIGHNKVYQIVLAIKFRKLTLLKYMGTEKVYKFLVVHILS